MRMDHPVLTTRRPILGARLPRDSTPVGCLEGPSSSCIWRLRSWTASFPLRSVRRVCELLDLLVGQALLARIGGISSSRSIGLIPAAAAAA